MITITANYVVVASDDIIICNSASAIHVNLPPSQGLYRELTIKNIGAGVAYVCSPDLIDAANVKALNQYDSITIIDKSVGVWSVIASDVFSSEIGANPTPVVRTNNPIVGAGTTSANIDALDAAIGADHTPVTRAVGQTAVANSVNANIDALDAVIGFDTQMSGSGKNASKSNSIYQNIEALDTYKSLRTVKVTIGAPGFGGTTFNFTSAANQNEQVIALGALIPAKCRLVDVMVHCDAVFTNAVSLVADVGITSGGPELITSGAIYNMGDIIASPNAGAFILTPSKDPINLFLNATPGANWSAFTAGSVSVYVTFIDVRNI